MSNISRVPLEAVGRLPQRIGDALADIDSVAKSLGDDGGATQVSYQTVMLRSRRFYFQQLTGAAQKFASTDACIESSTQSAKKLSLIVSRLAISVDNIIKKCVCSLETFRI